MKTLVFDIMVVSGWVLMATDKPWWGIALLLLAFGYWAAWCEATGHESEDWD